jgi:glycosyltransferase involved in cell wall biosynthesis
MKFLVIVQDLRISGTSEGIVSRSFLSKLRKTYPNSIIDVVYIKHFKNDDQLDLLSVDTMNIFFVDFKVPFFTRLLNKFFCRFLHRSLNNSHIVNKYTSIVAKIPFEQYNNIFMRSSGLEFEVIRSAKDLPILKNAIINFHDAYPVFWDSGSKLKLTPIELFKLKEMWEIVKQCKSCISPASLLSEDLQYLYGASKKFYTLPNQYDESVFDFSDLNSVRKKEKPITISYHGAIQFARNIDILIDAYLELVKQNNTYKENTEFIIRVRGFHNERLRKKYSDDQNVIILEGVDFANSSYEQSHETDILIILENCSLHSNILVGKAPFLASIKKPVLSLSPEKSELRRIIKNEKYIATCSDSNEIKHKLESLIKDRMNSKSEVSPFGDYFGDANFKSMIEKLISNS